MPFNYHKYITLPHVSNSRKKAKQYFKNWKPQFASVQYDENHKILGTILLTLKGTEYVAPEIIQFLLWFEGNILLEFERRKSWIMFILSGTFP